MPTMYHFQGHYARVCQYEPNKKGPNPASRAFDVYTRQKTILIIVRLTIQNSTVMTPPARI
jgi:hypothetical protein